MSFLTSLLEQLWGKTEPLLPMYHDQTSVTTTSTMYEEEEEEEDDEEEEEDEEYIFVDDAAAFSTEQDFVEYILDRSDCGNNYFFDMFNTSTRDRATGRTLQIWWMPRSHPYACMLRRSNDERFKYAVFDSHREVVAYQDFVIQEAVEFTRNTVGEWQKKNGNSPQPPPPPAEVGEEVVKEDEQSYSSIKVD